LLNQEKEEDEEEQEEANNDILSDQNLVILFLKTILVES
jgi:hypothetical protein